MAGVEGIEPPLMVLETSVIPLHHTPVFSCKLTVLETGMLPLHHTPIQLCTVKDLKPLFFRLCLYSYNGIIIYKYV